MPAEQRPRAVQAAGIVSMFVDFGSWGSMERWGIAGVKGLVINSVRHPILPNIIVGNLPAHPRRVTLSNWARTAAHSCHRAVTPLVRTRTVYTPRKERVPLPPTRCGVSAMCASMCVAA